VTEKIKKQKLDEIFYSKYFSNQASRFSKADLILQQWNDEKQFRNEILPNLPEEKNISILEIGCGSGKLVSFLLSKGYNYISGIDISEEMVDKAHASGLTNIYCGNVFEFLTNGEEIFDVIIGIDIIEHFEKEDLTNLLLLVLTRLKKNGRIIFRTCNMDAAFPGQFAYGDFTHATLLNASSAMQMMQSTGFTTIQIQRSFISVNGFLKNIVRKLSWGVIVFCMKIVLFASGRSSSKSIFSPNIIIVALK
jgi:2-polyprenyl-3-methyl-5-hydroxy-6-metoxy-1,4-benzoquinol methylase